MTLYGKDNIATKTTERVYAYLMTIREFDSIPTKECKSQVELILLDPEGLEDPLDFEALKPLKPLLAPEMDKKLDEAVLLWRTEPFYDTTPIDFKSTFEEIKVFYGWAKFNPDNCIMVIMKKLLYAIWNLYVVLNKEQDTPHRSLKGLKAMTQLYETAYEQIKNRFDKSASPLVVRIHLGLKQNGEGHEAAINAFINSKTISCDQISFTNLYTLLAEYTKHNLGRLSDRVRSKSLSPHDTSDYGYFSRVREIFEALNEGVHKCIADSVEPKNAHAAAEFEENCYRALIVHTKNVIGDVSGDLKRHKCESSVIHGILLDLEHTFNLPEKNIFHRLRELAKNELYRSYSEPAYPDWYSELKQTFSNHPNIEEIKKLVTFLESLDLLTQYPTVLDILAGRKDRDKLRRILRTFLMQMLNELPKDKFSRFYERLNDFIFEMSASDARFIIGFLKLIQRLPKKTPEVTH